MKAINPGHLMQEAGAALWLASEFIEVVELGPWAAGVTLGGMILEDVTKHLH
jgi:hypothetical protein